MRTNEKELFETTSDIWTVLSESPIFKTIFNMQSISGTLTAALESETAAEYLPHLASTGGIIHQQSEELTQTIADYLARCGIKPAQLILKE
jgi:hypothetical protein